MGQRRKDDGARKIYTIMPIIKQMTKMKGAIFPEFWWLMSYFLLLMLLFLEQPSRQS